ncbi:hypothetical protein PVAP13_2KG509400 [Panicum virgatum]|uniref:Uncharacterized protein n=1 Tax=Panicum virgatum TaxID=38727 RepID=A0A8T0WK58_PANVG|nr:hypothetical protein PVAP13_2KG509400 [Panicum virgatum]
MATAAARPGAGLRLWWPCRRCRSPWAVVCHAYGSSGGRCRASATRPGAGLRLRWPRRRRRSAWTVVCHACGSSGGHCRASAARPGAGLRLRWPCRRRRSPWAMVCHACGSSGGRCRASAARPGAGYRPGCLGLGVCGRSSGGLFCAMPVHGLRLRGGIGWRRKPRSACGPMTATPSGAVYLV